MTQATTHNTTTPRRAHPAVVRAALRSHNRLDVDARGLNTAVTRDQWNKNQRGQARIKFQVTDPLGQVKKYTYDAAHRRIKEDHYPSTGSGQAPAAAVKTISYSYNTLDRGARQGSCRPSHAANG